MKPESKKSAPKAATEKPVFSPVVTHSDGRPFQAPTIGKIRPNPSFKL